MFLDCCVVLSAVENEADSIYFMCCFNDDMMFVDVLSQKFEFELLYKPQDTFLVSHQGWIKSNIMFYFVLLTRFWKAI